MLRLGFDYYYSLNSLVNLRNFLYLFWSPALHRERCQSGAAESQDAIKAVQVERGRVRLRALPSIHLGAQSILLHRLHGRRGRSRGARAHRMQPIGAVPSDSDGRARGAAVPVVLVLASAARCVPRRFPPLDHRAPLSEGPQKERTPSPGPTFVSFYFNL